MPAMARKINLRIKTQKISDWALPAHLPIIAK
jgi:hypothetical protein